MKSTLVLAQEIKQALEKYEHKCRSAHGLVTAFWQRQPIIVFIHILPKHALFYRIIVTPIQL